MNIAIIDDERGSRRVLIKMIAQLKIDADKIFEFDSVENAIAGIHKADPDIVFLDINLGDGTGFEILDFFSKRNFKVVFVTGFDNYAIKAFKYSAVDYLLKPINLSELKLAFEKLEIAELQKLKLEFLQKNLQNDGEAHESILVPINNGYEVIRLNTIIKVEAEGNYSFLFLINNQKRLVVKNIGYFETLLPQSTFYRVHHSAIINVKFIKKYDKGAGGIVILENEIEQTVSSRKREAFLNFLKGIFKK